MNKIILLIGLLVSGLTYAQLPNEQESQITDTVIWKGKNGKTIRGVFLAEENGFIQVVEDGTTRLLNLRRETLSKETLDWYDRAQAQRADQKNKKGATEEKTNPNVTVPEAPEGYMPLNSKNLNRDKIPTLDQAKYGHKGSDCVPNSYAMFFLWWDEHSNLKIPRGRDFDDKAEWIHKELSRAFGTRNNSGTMYRDVDTGLIKFFERRYEDVATFKANREYDIRPATMAPYVKDGTCAVLCLSVYHDKRYEYGHAVSVLSLKEDGSIVFNTWGKKFAGKIELLEPLDKNERPAVRSAPSERYEVKLNAGSNIPQWMKEDEVRFILDPTRWDNLHVLIPYVKPEK